MSKLRSDLYRAARILGDVESYRSPRKFVKRRVRKVVYRNWFGLLRKLISGK